MFHSCTSLRYMTGQATCGGVVPLHFQLRDSRSCAIATEVCRRPKRDENSEEDPAQSGVLKRQTHDKRGSLHSFTDRSSRRCFALFSHIQKMQQFHLLHLFRLYLHDQKRFRLCSPHCNLSLPNSSGCCVISWRHQLYDVQTSYNILRLWERPKKPLTVQSQFEPEMPFHHNVWRIKYWSMLLRLFTRRIKDLTDFVLPKITWCWVCLFFLQHCWKTACIHQDRLVLVVLRQSTKSC